MINNLLELSINSNSIPIESINKTRISLTAYVAEHFSTEESLMKQYAVDLRHSDEFVIICSHTDRRGALAIGEKLNHFSTDKSGQELEFWKPSISIGISTINESTDSPSELLKQADDAMYVSKTKGGGRATMSH